MWERRNPFQASGVTATSNLEVGMYIPVGAVLLVLLIILLIYLL